MKIILDKSGSGKTAQLLSLCSQFGYTLVCSSGAGIKRAKAKAECLGISIPQPITVYDFISGKFNKSVVQGFCLDDAEAVLLSLARGIGIAAAVFTAK